MAELTDEELQALQEQAEAYNQLKADFDKAQEEREAEKFELEKLRAKDFNFRKLEKGTEEEKERMKEKVEKKEKALTDREKIVQELGAEMERKHNDFVAGQLSSAKQKVLQDLVGDDKELQEKVEFHAKTILGDMNNEDQIREKFEKAYLLSTGERPRANPLGAIARVSSTYTKQNPKRFTETPGGKEAYDAFFPDLAPIRNKK